IDPEENGIKARSPVSAKFMLQNIFSPDDVARVLIKVAMEAGKRYSYGRVLKELARYSNVQSILPEGEGRRSLAIRFYETTKKITWLNNTPHFWMQYAVARLAFAERDSGQLGFAERYFETAYAKARAIAGYETSMIDNHFARFLFMKAQVDEDAWFALFNEAASILRLQAGSVDERHYPYRVARNVEGVMARYESRMTVEQKEAVLNFCKSMYESSLKLMPNISSHPSVRDFKQRAKKMLARHDVQVE
ncbi:MAG: hypothetical protein NXI22_21730, partial [bacterium]|nr:hypothetical protein [bacterium]